MSNKKIVLFKKISYVNADTFIIFVHKKYLLIALSCIFVRQMRFCDLIICFSLI